jgi:hypothetical protein
VVTWLGQERLPPAITEESRAVRALWAALVRGRPDD